MDFREKRGAAFAPPGFAPWYAHDHRRTAGTRIVCGHWSTLGLTLLPNVLMLDSGCLWGGAMTAVRLPDGHVFQVGSRSPVVPERASRWYPPDPRSPQRSYRHRCSLRNLFEQFGMGSRTYKDDDLIGPATVKTVDQQEIATDMAFAVVGPLP